MVTPSVYIFYYLHSWDYFNPIFIVEILYKWCPSMYLFPTLCSVRSYWYLYINHGRIYPQKSENYTYKSCPIKLKGCLVLSCWTVVKIKSMSVSMAHSEWLKHLSNIFLMFEIHYPMQQRNHSYYWWKNKDLGLCCFAFILLIRVNQYISQHSCQNCPYRAPMFGICQQAIEQWVMCSTNSMSHNTEVYSKNGKCS